MNGCIDIWLKAGRDAPKKARRIIQTSTSRAKIGAFPKARSTAQTLDAPQEQHHADGHRKILQ
jgi:hypothetical protein